MIFMYDAAAWVSVGVFVAWIATKVMAVRGRGGGIGNLGVGVLGALAGGFATRTGVGADAGYDALIVSSFGALVGATAVIALSSLPLARAWRHRHAR